MQHLISNKPHMQHHQFLPPFMRLPINILVNLPTSPSQNQDINHPTPLNQLHIYTYLHSIKEIEIWHSHKHISDQSVCLQDWIKPTPRILNWSWKSSSRLALLPQKPSNLGFWDLQNSTTQLKNSLKNHHIFKMGNQWRNRFRTPSMCSTHAPPLESCFRWSGKTYTSFNRRCGGRAWILAFKTTSPPTSASGKECTKPSPKPWKTSRNRRARSSRMGQTTRYMQTASSASFSDNSRRPRSRSWRAF